MITSILAYLPQSDHALINSDTPNENLVAAINELEAYERNARRCGYWPYRPLHIQLLELFVSNALAGQDDTRGVA